MLELAHPKGLRRVKWLKLTRTHVSDLGVAELQKSLPQSRTIRYTGLMV
jgi:hypothetical protein